MSISETQSSFSKAYGKSLAELMHFYTDSFYSTGCFLSSSELLLALLTALFSSALAVSLL